MLHRQSFQDRTNWCQTALASPPRSGQDSTLTGGQGGGAFSGEGNVGPSSVAEQAAINRRRASRRASVLAAACLLPAIVLIGATLTALVASGPALASLSTSSAVQGGAAPKANSPARHLMAIAARRLTGWIVLGPGL